MSARRLSAVGFGAILTLALALGVTAPAPAGATLAQHLQNGGFESGSSGWVPVNFSTAGCTANSGASAARLSNTVSDPGSLRQTISGPFPGGGFSLKLYAKRSSGTPIVRAKLTHRDAADDTINEATVDIPALDAYGLYTLNATVPPSQSVVVSLTLLDGANTSVCVDDVTLDGPAVIVATDTPTPTLTSTPTETPTPTSTPTDTSTPTPTNTTTPQPSQTAVPTATATQPPPTATTAASAAQTIGFRNGGFEAGLDGWQKFGGELRVASSPALSGGAAGLLTSNTTSTKWAYAVATVDPAQTYEFRGALMPDAGVLEAYLRISWYESADGSGSALATDDSTSRVAGPSGSYVALTTGSRRPPPSARSARVRAMLAPRGEGAASLYLDDFSFAVVPPGAAPAPPPATTLAADEPVVVSTPPPPNAPAATATAATSPRSAASVTPTALVLTPTPTPFSQVSSARASQPSPAAPQPPASGAATKKANDGPGTTLVVLASGSLLFAAAAGAYVYTRRTRP